MALSSSILEKIKKDTEEKKKGTKVDDSSKKVTATQGSNTSSSDSTLSDATLNRISMDLALKKMGFTHNRETGLLNDPQYKDYYKKATSVNDDYINSFLNDWKSYSSKAESAYKGLNWKTSTSGEAESLSDAGRDLTFRSAMIRSYLNSHKEELGFESYKGFMDTLNSIDAFQSDFSNSISNAKRYYSQWDTEEDYNEYVAQQEEYEAKKNLDLEAGQKEIEELESKREELRQARTQPNTPYLNASSSLASTPYAAVAQSDNVYDKDIAELDKLISQKKAYLNQAKHIQEGITLASVSGNADFKDYKGYVSTYDDGVWSKLTSDYGLRYDDLTYEYINNKNGIRDEIKQKHRIYDKNDDESVYEAKGYDYMTSGEVSIYNYYYAKEGKKAAEKYLDSIQETLNHRKATSMYEEMEDHTALEMIFGVRAGVDQFQSGMKNLFNTEDDYIAQSAYQMASGMVREDLADVGPKLPDWMGGASVGQIGYDTITTSANMAPSILTSVAVGIINPVAGQWVGNAMMGASAAGNAYQEALNEGYSKDQARAYSILVGGSEMVMEKVLGGISALGGNGLGKFFTKNISNADTALKMIAKKLGGSIISEFSEEYLQEVLTPVFQNIALGKDEEVKLFTAEALYSGILGALTAGIMEGPSAVGTEVKTRNVGKQLQSADISAQRLAEIGNTFSADTVAYKLAGKVDETTGAYTMGRLFNEIGATLTEQNMNDITEALMAKGMTNDTARANAKAMASVVEGGNLTDLQVAIIESNEVLAEAVRTTIIDSNATWFQRTKGYNEALMALAHEKTTPKASRTNPAQQSEENAPDSDKVDTQNENGSESISEVDTSPANVKSISTIKNGQVTVKLDDGSEVNVREADLDPDDGVIIETIASIEGISSEDANFILSTLKAAPGISAQMDSLGAKEAYKYGYYGFSQDHIAKHGVFANSLNETRDRLSTRLDRRPDSSRWQRSRQLFGKIELLVTKRHQLAKSTSKVTAPLSPRDRVHLLLPWRRSQIFWVCRFMFLSLR